MEQSQFYNMYNQENEKLATIFNSRKLHSSILILTVLVCAGGGVSFRGNLLKNSDFELWMDENMPQKWKFRQIYNNKRVYKKVNTPFSGRMAVEITGNCEGEHLLCQIVPVSTNTIYTAQVALLFEKFGAGPGGLDVRGVDSVQDSIYGEVLGNIGSRIQPMVLKILKQFLTPVNMIR